MNEFKILRFKMSLLEPSGLGTKKIGETNCPGLRGQTSTAPISNNFAMASANLGDSELETGGCRGKGPTSGIRNPLITLRTLSSVVKDCHSDRNRRRRPARLTESIGVFFVELVAAVEGVGQVGVVDPLDELLALRAIFAHCNDGGPSAVRFLRVELAGGVARFLGPDF